MPATPAVGQRRDEDGANYVPNGRWKLDTSCGLCNAPFGFLRRRHHCRNCGLSVCDRHSRNRAIVPASLSSDPQRICDLCVPRCVRNTPRQRRARTFTNMMESNCMTPTTQPPSDARPVTRRARSQSSHAAPTRSRSLREAPSTPNANVAGQFAAQLRRGGAGMSDPDQSRHMGAESPDWMPTREERAPPAAAAQQTRQRSGSSHQHAQRRLKRVLSGPPDLFQGNKQSGATTPRASEQRIISLRDARQQSRRLAIEKNGPVQMEVAQSTSTHTAIEPRKPSSLHGGNNNNARVQTPRQASEPSNVQAAKLERAQSSGTEAARTPRRKAGSVKDAREYSRHASQQSLDVYKTSIERGASSSTESTRTSRRREGSIKTSRDYSRQGSQQSGNAYKTSIERSVSSGADSARTSRRREGSVKDAREYLRYASQHSSGAQKADAELPKRSDTNPMTPTTRRRGDSSREMREYLLRRALEASVSLDQEESQRAEPVTSEETETVEAAAHKIERARVHETSSDEQDENLHDEFLRMALQKPKAIDSKKPQAEPLPTVQAEVTKGTLSRGSSRRDVCAKLLRRALESDTQTRVQRVATEPGKPITFFQSDRKRFGDFVIPDCTRIADSKGSHAETYASDAESERTTEDSSSKHSPLTIRASVDADLGPPRCIFDERDFSDLIIVDSPKIDEAQVFPKCESPPPAADEPEEEEHETSEPRDFEVKEAAFEEPVQTVIEPCIPAEDQGETQPDSEPAECAATTLTMEVSDASSAPAVSEEEIGLLEEVAQLEATIHEHQSEMIQLIDEWNSSEESEAAAQKAARESHARVRRLQNARAVVCRSIRVAAKCLQGNEHDAAILELVRAAAIEPTNAKVWFQLAEARMKVGELGEAEEAARICVELQDTAFVQVLLGRILHRQQRFAEAIECFEQSLL